MKKGWLFIVLVAIVLMVFVFFISKIFITKRESYKQGILIHVAAYLKPVFEDIVKEFEMNNPEVKINLNFGSSSSLLSQIVAAKVGDIFISADESDMIKADQNGLIGEYKPLIKNVPVIILRSDLNLDIKSLKDLLNYDIKIGIGNQSTPIGRLSIKMFKSLDMYEEIKDKIVYEGESVNAVASKVQLKIIDAGIVWDNVAKNTEDIKIINFEEQKKNTQISPCGILKFTQNKKLSRKFFDFLWSKKAKEIFEKFSYTVLD